MAQSDIQGWRKTNFELHSGLPEPPPFEWSPQHYVWLHVLAGPKIDDSFSLLCLRLCLTCHALLNRTNGICHFPGLPQCGFGVDCPGCVGNVASIQHLKQVPWKLLEGHRYNVKLLPRKSRAAKDVEIATKNEVQNWDVLSYGKGGEANAVW